MNTLYRVQPSADRLVDSCRILTFSTEYMEGTDIMLQIDTIQSLEDEWDSGLQVEGVDAIVIPGPLYAVKCIEITMSYQILILDSMKIYNSKSKRFL